MPHSRLHLLIAGLFVLYLVLNSILIESSQVQVAIPSDPQFNNEKTVTPRNCTRASTEPVLEIQITDIPPEKFRFLHVGKTGGGTFLNRVQLFWKIQFLRCHPIPCPNTKADSFVVPLRDPIDRFVSAFYYSMLLLCNPRGDSRKYFGGLAWDDPKHFCLGSNQVFWKRRTDLLFGKYHQSINALAESLCTDGQARLDMQDIEHMDPFEAWLPANWTIHTDRIFPVVLEMGFDLDSQIDSSIRWINQFIRFENVSEFAQRQDYVSLQDCKVQDQSSNLLAMETLSKVHSSKTHGRNPLLTHKGERCVAEFYARDYEILRLMKDKVCKMKECQAALESILNRRIKLLPMKY